MKKLMAIFLMAALICTMITGFVSVSAAGEIAWMSGSDFLQSQVNNNVYTDLYANHRGYYAVENASGSAAASLVQISDTDNALQLVVTEKADGAIKTDNAPAYRNMVYAENKSVKKAIYIRYQVNIKDYAAEYTNFSGKDEGVVFAIRAAEGQNKDWTSYLGSDANLAFKADGKVGNTTFAKNKWYQVETYIDFQTQEAITYLTDLETSVRTHIATDVIGKNVTEMNNIRLEVYRPSTVLIDAIRMGECPAFNIYSTAEEIASSGKMTVGIADNAQNAGVYVNDSLVQAIVPGTSTALSTGQYQLSVPLSSGDNNIEIRQTTEIGSYSKNIVVTKSGALGETLQLCDFASSSDVAATLGGGMDLRSGKVAYETDEDGTTYARIYTQGSYTYYPYVNAEYSKDTALATLKAGDVYEMAYRFKLAKNCQVDAYVIMCDEGYSTSANATELTRTMFNSDGKISKLGTDYNTNQWYLLRMVVDTGAKTVSYYIDNDLIETKTYTGEYIHTRRAQIRFMTYDAEQVYYVDKFYRTRINENAITSEAVIADKNDASGKICADAGTLSVKFNKALNPATLTTQNVSVKSGERNIAVSGITYDGETKVASLALSEELSPGSDLYVAFNENVQTADNKAFSTPYTLYAKTGTYSATRGEFTVTKLTDTSYNAQLNINYAGEVSLKDGMLIIASYIGNKMTACKMEKADEKGIVVGANNISISLNDPEAAGATEVRAFLWSADMLPVVNSGIWSLK